MIHVLAAASFLFPMIGFPNDALNSDKESPDPPFGLALIITFHRDERENNVPREQNCIAEVFDGLVIKT